MLEKTLNMADITLAAYELYQDPQNENLKAKYNEYDSKIVILSYAPLREKQAGVLNIAMHLQEQQRRPDDIAVQVQLLLMLEIFNIYTNIKVDSNFYDIFNVDFYDAISACGLWNEIETHCSNDLKSFRSLLESTLNWRNVYTMVDEFSSIDMSHVDQLVQEVREAKEKLGEDNIKLLKEVAMFNRPDVDRFQDVISASLVAGLDKVSETSLSEWHKQRGTVVDLDAVLGQNTLDHIIKEVSDHFATDQSLSGVSVTQQEITDVYTYLKNKNQEEINKIDADISEENKSALEKGITSQVIKLLSKKKALDRKYKQQEELIKLADAIMSMNGQAYDDIKKVLEQYSANKEESIPAKD